MAFPKKRTSIYVYVQNKKSMRKNFWKNKAY
uniref:Ribosomal protein L32 n=1 Tax=Aquilegia rockii TaxID=1291456 RepID=A0A6G6DAM5_9MAGN|nr:ribosomal protein L32 [Aquilegia rockii]QIE13494.1 ribosomal protein L32 [Aquilegia rockii]